MRKTFNKAASGRPATLTLRLSPEERARLEREATGMPLSAYVRERVFGPDAKPRKTRGKAPVQDHVKLAGVLRRLGQLNLTQDFAQSDLSPEQYRDFQRACADIAAMRRDLLAALGMRPGGSP
ncbi:MAG: hypothetical protein AAGK00_06720 [Pseudomonadota bacterium]